MKYLILFFLLASLFLASCSVLTPPKVLEKGERRLSLSIGGPFVPSSSPALIIPYTTFGYAEGLHDDLTISGNFHLLSAAYKIFAVDAGVVHRLSREQNFYPELSIYPKLYFFHNFKSAEDMRAFISMALTGSYVTGNKNFIYFGFDTFYQFAPSKVLITPYTGFQFNASRKLNLQAELKWMASNEDTRHGIFEGESAVGGKGVIGFFIGASYGL
jgi:hypothetical protein